MITSIVKAVKNFLGFDTSNSLSRKRSHQDARSDYSDDISTDEETDFENIKSTKRRKLESTKNQEEMASWIRPSKGFSQTFFYRKKDNPHDTNYDHLFATPKLTSTEKNALTSDSQSSVMSHRSEPFECNGDDENDENKYLRKRSFSDLRSKELGKNFSQRPLSTNSFVNGSYHGHLLNQNCDSNCQLRSISPNANNFSARLTVSRCAQIQEKEKYKQLLNRYPQPFVPVYGNDSLSLRHSLNHSVANSSSSSHKNSVIREKLNTGDRQKQIQNILQSSSSKKKQNVNCINGIAASSSEDASLRTSIRLGQATRLNNTNGAANPSTSNQSTNEVKKWKLKCDELNCPYSNKLWLEKWKITLKSQDNERRRQITEARQRIDAVTPAWEKDFRELEKNIKDQLSIAEKQSEVLEEIYSSKDVDKDLLDDEKKPMPELTPEMEKKIDDALRPKPPNEVLVDRFQIPIHRRDMETLQDLNWLNDAIINFYMNLLMERGKLDNMPSVYACNTFFYPKLINGGHSALKRWTRKIDIFGYDIMLVPVHLEVHWCLAVVDFRNKLIKYYDSMGGKNNECLNALSTYLQDESLDKKKRTLSMDDWALKNVSNAPRQKNSSDCGMFACKYAEYITRDAKLTFKQHHMPYFRRRMVYEILTTQLL